MPGGFLNQARMSISTTGTGTFTLAAAIAPFQTFANAGAVDQQIIKYSAVDGVAGSEKGWGLYSAAGPTLTRNVLLSTNGNAPINASGATQVFIDPDTADLGMLNAYAQANLGGL
jgi:hypothetical protein